MNPNWRDHLKPWKPGESGNPKGRPKGSRNKINQEYLDAICADFEQHGPAVLERVRETMPHVWIKLVAELMPKHVQVEHAVADMTEEQLERRLAEVRRAIADETGAVTRGTGTVGGTAPTDTKH